MKIVVGLGNPGSQYARDPPQHRLDGRSTGSPTAPAGPAVAGSATRRRSSGPLHGPRPDARQAADVHERVGPRGPQGPRPRARAAGRPARRRRRLRAAVRQAPLPRGRRRRRPQRPALDHRRARHREVQPAPGRDRRAGPGRVDHVLSTLRAGRDGSASTSCSTPPPTRSRRGRARARARPRTASTRSSCGRPTTSLLAPPGEVDGPPGADGIRRTRTGWRRIRPAAEDRAMPTPPLRGRRGRDRRIAERVADDFARATRAGRGATDFDVAEVDAEVEDATRAARARGARRGSAARPAGRRRRRGAAAGCRTSPRCRRCSAATGSFAALRERLGPPRRRAAATRATAGTSAWSPCRTARRATSPRPSPSATAGERLVLDRPRRRDRRPRRRGARRVARRPGGRRRPRAADRARLRAQRARRRRDGRPRRGAGRLAERPRPGPRRERPGARSSTRSRPDDLPDEPRELRARRPAPPGRAAARPARSRLRAGRSRSPAAASSPGAAASSTSSRRRRPLPVRIEFFGDEIDSLRAFDPTDQRTVGPVEAVVLLPASEFLAARAAASAAHPRAPRPGAARCPSASPRTWPGSRPRTPATAAALDRRTPSAGARPGRSPSATRPRSGPPLLAPATGLDHVDAGHAPRPRRARRHRRGRRLPVAPGRRAPRRARSRPASCRRTGRRPTSPPRDWKAPARRRPDARADLGVRAARGRRDRRRRPVVRRPVRLARAGAAAGPGGARSPRRSSAGRPTAPRIVLASRPGPAPRGAPRRGRPPGRASSTGSREAPPPGAIALVERSLNGGFAGGPDGLVFVTDRELFGTVRVRRPKALRRVVPRDILERLDARRPRRPHRPRRRPLRADAPARRRPARTATTSS